MIKDKDLIVYNRKDSLNAKGNTEDIITEIINCYNDFKNSTVGIALKLKGASELETCKNVFDFAIENVKYNEDPAGVQLIRTPARLLHDGEGDCKSYAILIASILDNLNIPCMFRFVSFTDDKQYTHVYIVTESGIIIDPVERVDGKPIFNYASDYTHKLDMNTTHIYRLSGTDNREVDSSIYTPYMGNTAFINNTVALNNLYSYFNLYETKLQINGGIENYNAMDFFTVAITLYDKSNGNKDLVVKCGSILQMMYDCGKFSSTSTNYEERETTLIDLIDSAVDHLYRIDVNEKGNIYDWWQSTVVECNYNSVPEQVKRNYIEALSTDGIGAVDNDTKNEIITKIQQSAPYFLYYFLPKKWVVDNKRTFPEVYKKYYIEESVFKAWVKAFTGCLSETAIYNHLQTGFYKRTNSSPEQFINNIIEGKGVPKVGIVSATVIAAIISGVVAIITALINMWQKVAVAKVSAPENYPQGAAADSDLYTSISKESGTTNNIPLLLGAVAVAFLLIKNND